MKGRFSGVLSKEEEFLEKYVFYDLEDLNDGFDSPSIKYFSKDDFEKILETGHQSAHEGNCTDWQQRRSDRARS